MFTEKRKLRFLDRSILVIFTGLVILCAGCGPSSDERWEKEAAERKEQTKRKIAGIEKEFSAVYFPPEEMNDALFTYEIQKFFKGHAEGTVVFKGRLEDIEASKKHIIAEFVCEEFPARSAEELRIRLTVSEANVGEFLKAKRDSDRDYFIVAKIVNIQAIRKYEYRGYLDSYDGDEGMEVDVYIDTEVSRGLVATGQLIKAIPIPKQQ